MNLWIITVSARHLSIGQIQHRLSLMVSKRFRRLTLIIFALVTCLSPPIASAAVRESGDDPEPAGPLEFDSRIALYRYLQSGLEDFFDTGDSARIAELEQAARFVAESLEDDFFLRQCRKFRVWQKTLSSVRGQLKIEYAINLSGLSGTSGPSDKFRQRMVELGGRFLEIGDSVAAVNCWQHAARWQTGSEEAERLLARAVTVSRLVGDRDGLSRSFNLVGRIYDQNARFVQAGAYFDSARVIKAELGDDAGVADALSNIASVYLSLGDRGNALRFAGQSLQLRRNLSDSGEIMQTLLTMIPAFARDVPIATAEDWYGEAVRLSGSQSVPQQDARLPYCSAIIAELQGSIDTALSHYSRSLALATKARNSRLALAVLQSQAALESSMGRYFEALAHDVAAQELAVSTHNRAAEATILHNLGSLHQRLGDLDQSIDYYQRALEIRRQMGINIQSAETLSNLAEIYLATGDFGTAEIYVRQAAAIAELTNDRRRLSTTLTRLAQLRQLLGDHSGAMAMLDSATMVESEALTLQRRIDYLCLQAEFSRQARDYAQADSYLSQAFVLLDSCATYTNRQRIEIIDAELAVDRNQWLKAYEVLAAIIARSEKSRGSIPDPQLRTSFQSQSRSIYEEMVRTLYNLRTTGQIAGLDDSLLAYMEKAKSRGLLDVLGGEVAGRNSQALGRTKTDESRLLSQLEKIESSLVDDGDPQSIKRKLAQLSELDHQLSDLRVRSRVEGGAPARIYTPEPIPISKLQSTLRDDRTALLAFLLTPEASYAVRIDRRSVAVEELPDRSRISSAVAEFARLIQLSIKDESLLDNLEQASATLGSWLFPPTLFPPRAYDRVLISADGILNVLPFEALRIDGKYLIEYAAVASVPSLFLAAPAEDTSQSVKHSRLLAISDPQSRSQKRQLPYSAREVDWISEIFGKKQCTILTAAMATKSELLRLQLTDFGIVHIATHSTINYGDPRRSRIWLSSDTASTDSENFLTLAEVDDLKLGADLVVLSLCESGGGNLDIGEGMDGFVKAFMSAGAHNMLVSLWEVEDFTTATFMKTFYQNLNAGYAEALRRAKLEMITSPRLRHRHPYYWSPFKLSLGGRRR